MSGHRNIRRVRVDVPLTTLRAYLFVDPEMAKWDAWWEELYRHLLTYASRELDWRHEPVQNVFVARPTLTAQDRKAIHQFLRSAPQGEIDGHRTLRRATELNPQRACEIELMYFSAP
jgi:hypothetical protein